MVHPIKKRALCAGLAGILAILAVCTSAGAASTGPITLSHLVYTGHHESHEAYVREKALEFSRRHPEVTIEVIANTGDYVERAVVAAAAGVAFDVLEPTSAHISSLVTRNMFMDLLPLLERSDLSLDAFPPISLVPYRWGAELYCIPSQLVAVTSIANVRLFQEAGVPTPQQMGEAWNWDSLVEISPKLSADTDGDGVNDRWSVLLPSGFNRVVPAFVHNAGGDVFDEQVQPRRATFTSDPAVRIGLQFYLDLYWRDWLTTEASTFRSEERTAINLTDGAWWIGLVEELDQPFAYEVAPYPKGPARQGSEIAVNGYCGGRQTAHPEWVFEWIRFLTADYENVVEYMRRTGRPTAYMPAASEYLRLFSENHPDSISVWLEVLTHPDVRVRTVTPVYAEVSSEFNREFRSVMNRQNSLENFLNYMNTFAQTRLDEAWQTP